MHCLFFAVFCSLSVLSPGQNQLPFTQLTPSDGLPSPEVYDVSEDRNGYLWFATDRGLSKYNGYEFTNYSTFNSNLSCNTVFKTRESPKGDFWFTCYDGTITIYHHLTDQLEQFEFNDSLLAHSSWWIQDVQFKNDNVYLFPVHLEKVFVYNEKKRTFEVLDLNRFFYRSSQTKPASSSKTFHWTDDIPSITLRRPGSPHHYELAERTIPAGDSCFFSFDNTLYCKTGDSFHEIHTFPEKISYLYRDSLYGMFVMTGNAVYCASRSNYKAPLLRGYSFTNMCRDRDGNYWFTTLEKGVLKVPALFAQSHLLPTSQNFHEKTTALCLFREHLLIGTSRGYLHNLASDGEQVELLDSPSSKSDYVKRISITGNVAYASGLRVITWEKDHFRIRRRGFYDLCQPLPGDSFLLADQGPAFTIGSLTASGKLITSRLDNFNEHILCIAEGPLNTFWLGTQNGVWKLEAKDPFNAQKASKYKMLQGRISDILCIDDHHRLFSTIGNGLTLTGDDMKPQTLTTNEGLCSNMINRIRQENDSIYWAGTNKGLSKLKLTKVKNEMRIEVLENIGATEGLPGNYIYDLLFWKNKLWIATDKGLFSFEHHKYYKSRTLPKIFLTGIWIGDSNYVGTKEFNHSQNDVSFSFEGLCYKKPTENFYKYRLTAEESKGDWAYTNDRQTSFTDLPPGSYTFEVSARNTADQWAEAQSLPFFIKPHFTQTMWFRISMVISVLALIIFLGWWRLNEIRVQGIRNERIRELELSMLRNQMNPHFVFNALNAVQNFMVNSNITAAMAYLGKFSTLMRNSLNFSRQNYISLEEELRYIRNYLEIEQVRFPDRFTYAIQLPDEMDETEIKIPPLLLQPILENTIKHAFPDSIEKGHLSITLILLEEENMLTWIVRDNGIGIDLEKINNPRKASSSKGLKIVEERLELMNENRKWKIARMLITNLNELEREGRGTEIEIVLPYVI